MRSRNIKPGFFKNDTLAEINPLGRILYEGLWCLADRKGRLKDRPKRIKAEILPYDDCGVDSFLNDLQKNGFILRYVIDNNKYIQVVNFLKHQRPHPNEKASDIPAPTKKKLTYNQSVTNDAPKREQGITKERSNPSDIMIPDIMIPDSLNSLSSNEDKQPEPAAQSSNHFSDQLEDNQLQPILALCDNITKRVRKGSNGKRRFEPYKFIQQQVNNKGHPQAILKTLESMLANWHKIKNPWAYVEKVMKQESAKAYARDSEQAHKDLKAEWVAWERTDQFKKLGKLVENIGNINAI